MKISIIGTGYVGLVTAVCFSEMGNSVTCIDVDKGKIKKLRKGIPTIYEPGLRDLLLKNLDKSIFFTTKIDEGIIDSEIIFIAVGTPMSEDGSADLSSVFSVSKSIGESLKKEVVIVSKSTVPVGTTDKIAEVIREELNKRNVDVKFDMVSNPEFLKEGAAIEDFMKPDRIVIGAETEYAIHLMKELYAPFFRTNERFVTMDIRSSEMTKYAANAMLATKISFINEMANICEKVNADINQVRIGIGSDSRIGYNFIYPGIGYGGTCFPKDISALIKLGNDNGFSPKLISSVNEINQNQKKIFLNKIVSRFGEDLSSKTFAVWGLSFKPETDDMREAPSIYIINKLIEKGAKVNAFDPKSMNIAKNVYFKGNDKVSFYESKYEALFNVNALILLTEWKEFRSPNFYEIKSLMKENIIFDGRNQYNAFNLQEKGFEYYQIGKNYFKIT